MRGGPVESSRPGHLVVDNISWQLRRGNNIGQISQASSAEEAWQRGRGRGRGLFFIYFGLSVMVMVKE